MTMKNKTLGSSYNLQNVRLKNTYATLIREIVT